MENLDTNGGKKPMKEEVMSLQRIEETKNKRKAMKAVMIGNWIINLENCTHITKELKEEKHLLHFANVNSSQTSWEFATEEELNNVFNQVWKVISGEPICQENAITAESTP